MLAERIPSLRTKVGSNRSPSPWIVLFIFLFLAGILLMLFLRSPLSKVDQVQISGNQLLSDKRILVKARVKPNSSYFDLNEQSIRDSLLKLPEVANVEVMKRFPNRLYIRLHEQPIVAYLQSSGRQFVPVLGNGLILRHQVQLAHVEVRPVILSEQWNSQLATAVRGLASIPESLRKQFLTIERVRGQADQIVLRSQYHHRVHIRVDDIRQKLPLYISFRHHPPGTIYLLRGIWFQSDGDFPNNR